MVRRNVDRVELVSRWERAAKCCARLGTDQRLKLDGVPTLYRWGRDGPSRRLVEREITDAALSAFLTAPV